MNALAPVSDIAVARLVQLDRAIDQAEDQGLRARWEFGRDLLGHRVGKQLPRDLLADVVAETGKSRWELQQRMRFAQLFPTEDEVFDAIKHFGSWFRIVHEALPEPRELTPVPDELPPLPAGEFRVVVADPPWQYGNKATRGAAEDHYATMTIPELCELPVEEQVAEGAHLYLWTTNGFLREAFDVVEAWGFTYKTCLTWVKPQMGMGNYFRSSTEHVLFGVRGGLATQDRAMMNWFEARRGRHSQKPDCFYDLVEKASPGPYLEMFARRRRLGDWSVWGNEA